MAASTPAKSDAVAVPAPNYMDVHNFDALIDLAGPDILSGIEVFGDGYVMVDKSELVDKEFLLNSFRTAPGQMVDDSTGEVKDFGIFTAVLRLPIAVDGALVNRVRFTDGGTGLTAQAQGAVAKAGGSFRPVHVKKGLSVSTYKNPAPNAAPGSMATTYYFATSA